MALGDGEHGPVCTDIPVKPSRKHKGTVHKEPNEPSPVVRPMPTITVRNVPDHIHQHLKRRAEEHRRSLNQEVLRVLEDTVTESSPSDPQALRRACAKEQGRTPSWSLNPREMKRTMREELA